MIQIGIRTLTLKKGNRISNDYKEQMRLIKNRMKGKIESSLRETDGTAIYQYYSMAPFYCVEARFLRRMNVGSSVMCVRESLEDYVASAHLPQFLKQLLYSYVKVFLNSLDYIVITDENIERKLRQEGIRCPGFYTIPISGEKVSEERESYTAGLWMEFYQKAAKTVSREEKTA